MQDMPSAGGYLALFKARHPRPEPRQIVPCRNRAPGPVGEANKGG
jgi:hypothetical protein